MLILSRKAGERIVIGDNIILTVVSVTGGRIRLGVTAPIEISVHRHEVHEQLQQAGRSSTTTAGSRTLSDIQTPASSDSG